jgi:uncharacterized protein (TIGR01619 family)
MKENWRSYFCNVNESLASIFVNLALRDAAPVASKPWLLWVTLDLHSPKPNGMYDSSEVPALFKIEDALTSQLFISCGAEMCGRITTEGRREFYYYGETKEGFHAAVTRVLSGFPGYGFDAGEQEDVLWEQYLDVLYPSRADLERIKNQDLIEVLTEKGDVLTAAREVQHWIYFQCQDARALFRDEIAKAGFRVETESFVEGGRPFGISGIRTQSVEQERIDATVIEILRLAERFDGDYDGWETPVITQ